MSGPRDPFVGRREELASLVELLNGTGSRGKAALVSGEAGIGKTRLLSEFREWVRENGAQVLQGHCYQAQDIQPYFPFLQVIDQLRLRPASPGRFLSDLAGDSPQGRAFLTGPDAVAVEMHSARTAFLRAVCDAIITASGEAETVLCIEDIQWADEGSLLLLNYLLDLQAPSILAICTLRPDGLSGSASRQLLARVLEKSVEVRLRGLDLAEFRELIRAHSTPGEMTTNEVDALHEFTGGSPLLGRELVLGMRERGVLTQQTLPESLNRNDPMPDRVALVLDMRLETLNAQAAELADAASVIGTEFSEKQLGLLVGADVAAVEDGVASLLRKRIVEEVEPLVGSRFRFSHPLYRSRIYEQLLPSRRRELHRRLAESGEALSVDEVAFHFAEGFGAERSRETVAYCQQAAEQAESIFAYESAARFWHLALNCSEAETANRADLYSRLGWSLWAASKWADAVEAWSEAIELLEGSGDSGRIESLALALGETHRLRAEDAAAERWLDRALRVPVTEASHRARALALLASIHALRRNTAAARPLLDEAQRLVQDGDDDPMVLAWLANTLMTSGRRAESYTLARRGLRAAQRRNMSWPVVMLAGNLAMQELGHLRLKTATRYVAVMERALPEGNAIALQRYMFCRAWLLAYGGDWQDLADFATEWMARVRFSGDFQTASARMFFAHAMAALGDLARARNEMMRALPYLDQTIPIAAMSLARIHVLEGDTTAARGLAHQYAGRLLRDRRATAAAGKAILGDVAADLDEPKLWSVCYRALTKEEWPLVIAHAPVSVQRVLGRLAVRMKRWEASKHHFDSATEQLGKGGASWELGRAYADAASMLRQRRRRGDTDKAAALAETAQRVLDATMAGRDFGNGASRLARLKVVLTGRQQEILALIAKGLSNPEIAAVLTLSPRTVERHVEEIRRRFGARSRAEAVAHAVAQGLIEASDPT